MIILILIKMEFGIFFCLKIISLSIFINTLIDSYNLYLVKNLIYIRYFYKSNFLNIIKGIVSISLFLFTFDHRINFVLILFLLFSEIIFFKKNINFKDASDNVQFYILSGLLISQFSPKFGLIIIVTVMLIIYHMMGFFKLKSEIWRKGDAIFNVINTETFGMPLFALFLKKNYKIKIISSWTIILLQLTFPFCLISQEICFFYLISGFVFHLFIMVVMKLHNFFWVFVSTYPCIYILSINLEKYFF